MTAPQVALVPVAFDDPRATRLLADFGADMQARYPGSEDSHAEPDQFAAPPAVFLLALEGERPLGCAGLRVLGPGLGEVKRVWVDPAARGRGLARALMAELVRRARAGGLARLVLEAGTGQPEARALYESEGWQPVEPYGQYRDDPRCRCYALDL